MSEAGCRWSSPAESHPAAARRRWAGSRCAARCGQTVATRIEHLTGLRRRRIHRSRTNTVVTASASCWSSPVVMMKSPTARANYRLNGGGSKAKFLFFHQTNKLPTEVFPPGTTRDPPPPNIEKDATQEMHVDLPPPSSAVARDVRLWSRFLVH